MPFSSPNSIEWDPLLKKAWKARDFAYAPYSNFKVGAALIDRNGKIFVGCNVENASYGATCCAERNAIFQAVATGAKHGDIRALVVVTDTKDLTPPCGICRQVMAEFEEKLPILLANRSIRILHDISELLPHSFSRQNL